MKDRRLSGIRIVGVVVATLLVALLVFAGLGFSRQSHSENIVGSASDNVTEPDQDYVVSVVGDISLADNWKTMPMYVRRGSRKKTDNCGIIFISAMCVSG